MAPKDLLREELDDTMVMKDRRTAQPKAEIDVSDLDDEDLGNLREEEINNLNENELSQLDAHVGVSRRTDEASDILPVEKLDQDLEDEEDR